MFGIERGSITVLDRGGSTRRRVRPSAYLIPGRGSGVPDTHRVDQIAPFIEAKGVAIGGTRVHGGDNRRAPAGDYLVHRSIEGDGRGLQGSAASGSLACFADEHAFAGGVRDGLPPCRVLTAASDKGDVRCVDAEPVQRLDAVGETSGNGIEGGAEHQVR